MTSSFSPVAVELVNITIDDGDLTTKTSLDYEPNGGTWHVGSPAENCTSCKITPATFDLSQIHEQTWHDATHTPPLTPATVTVHFNGSAVYVFNILPNTLFNTTTFVNITFNIDGEDAGIFTRSPDSSSTILYNQLVYRNVALQDGPHILVMTAGGDTKSLFLFDYLLYTTQGNDSTTTTKSVPVSTIQPSILTSTPTGLSQSPSGSASRTPVGAIVGGVVGGVAVLLGIVTAAVLRLRRRSLRSNPSRIEARIRTTVNRHGGKGSENDGFLVSSSATGIFPSPKPSIRSLDSDPFAGVGTRSFPSYALDPQPELATGPGLSPDALHAPKARPDHDAAAAPAPSTDQGSSKCRVELTRRLENLQRTWSILSSFEPGHYGSSPSGQSEFKMGSRTQRAMGELEAEIAELRTVLATLNSRLADSEADERESLPAYAE